MIKIPQNISISKIYSLYSEFESTDEEIVDIELPKKNENMEFGILFSFLQFLATWLRSTKSGKLILPIDSENEKEVEEEVEIYMHDNEIVYPSIVLSWEKEIISRTGKKLKNILKKPSKKYFNKMDFFELKGMIAPIYCFDHDKSNRGLSRHLYNKRDLVSEDFLGFNLHRAFTKICGHNYKVTRKSIRDNYDSFSAIIHELFANTHDHAKTNELGNNLYPNIRAILLKFHKKPAKKFLETYKDHKGLINFFKSDFKVNNQNDIYLIEISILDSGPGIVKRYKGVSGYDFPIDREVELIKECLYRHNTSEEGLGGEVKGIGLDRVLRTIDGKGFVRIKSGRADVFRDMKNNQYTHHDRASKITLNDWKSNSISEFTVNSPVQGTLISIFYPLEFE